MQSFSLKPATFRVSKSRLTAALVAMSVSFFSADASFGQAATAKDAKKGISMTKPDSGPFVAINNGADGYMVPYTESVDQTDLKFEMIPIPGGEFKMGSPASESGHSDDEGPQVTVVLEPYWMAKHELTWAEYKTFMKTYDIFKKLSRGGVRKVTSDNQADAITVPTPLYEPSYTYEHGDDPAQPAVTMTQYAAKQYTKWLSALAANQYRLPTEAEWEHAARGGTETAYSFGDNADEIDKYAVFDTNAPNGAAKVGSKLPNPFGLHDMHGNVWEWTIDQYTANGYADRKAQPLVGLNAVHWPQSADMRCVRGGGWQDPAERVRSAARMGSIDEDWKESDPNDPLSPWWYTTDPARMVGMRLVRSLKPMDAETISKFWEIDNDDIREVVEFRIREGRGVKGLAVPELLNDFQKKKK